MNSMSRKLELIKNLRSNTYCRIKPSKIEGVGVFAIKRIPKGANPFVGSNRVKYIGLTDKEINKLNKEVRLMIGAFFSKQKGLVWIPQGGLNSIDISFFMNTSKAPNIGIRNHGEQFFTLKSIAKNEELTIDYDLFDENKFKHCK